MNNKFFYPFIFLLIFSACSLTKPNTGNKHDKEIRKVFDYLEKAHFVFKTIDAKARLFIKNEEISQNISIDLKIIHDSLIWVSAKMMGFEIVRIFINQENITIIDKLNSSYSVVPLIFIKDHFALPYYHLRDIEAILTGKLLFIPDGYYDVKKDSNVMIFEYTVDSLHQSLIFDRKESAVSGYKLDYPQLRQRAEIRYREKIRQNRFEIPKIVEIWAYLPEENYLKLNYFSIRFNEAIECDTSIPSGYLQTD